MLGCLAAPLFRNRRPPNPPRAIVPWCRDTQARLTAPVEPASAAEEAATRHSAMPGWAQAAPDTRYGRYAPARRRQWLQRCRHNRVWFEPRAVILRFRIARRDLQTWRASVIGVSKPHDAGGVQVGVHSRRVERKRQSKRKDVAADPARQRHRLLRRADAAGAVHRARPRAVQRPSGGGERTSEQPRVQAFPAGSRTDL